MQVIDTIAGFRKALDAERAAGKTIGLVPTMGALHAGHASLIDAARATCDIVAVTVFVNPLQFGPSEDLAKYPRPFDADVSLASEHAAAYVFHPSVDEMYPDKVLTTVHVAEVSDGMEGAVRPGHFDGVATVVAKLFNAAGPCKAFFGEKDYQQLQVVTAMVRDLSFPVEIVPCPIVREPDGLALSSRNVYLSAEDRAAATVLYRALRAAAAADPDNAVEVITTIVNAEPRATLDYAETVVTEHEVRLLVAVKFGTTRLIDNLGVAR